MFFLAFSQNYRSDQLVRSITITPGYWERKFNSNETMKYFPLTVMQASSKGFDALMEISKGKKYLQWLIGSAYILPVAWLAFMNTNMFHEYGHGQSAYAEGGNYYFSSIRQKVKITDYALGIYTIKPFDAAGTRTYDLKYNGRMLRNGINNQTRLAQEVGNLIFQQNGHFLYLWDYLMAKPGVLAYTIMHDKGYLGRSNDILIF